MKEKSKLYLMALPYFSAINKSRQPVSEEKLDQMLESFVKDVRTYFQKQLGEGNDGE